MHLTDLDQVFFANQGLSAGVDVHIGSHLFALTDNGIDGLQGQIQLMAVLRCPASGAVQVAGRSRIQQDSPGNVAVVLLGNLFLQGAALQAGVGDEIGEERFPHAGIQGVDLLNQLEPVALLVDGFPDGVSLALVPVCGHQLVDHIHQLGGVVLRILLQIAQRGVDCSGNRGCLDFSSYLHNPFTPSDFRVKIYIVFCPAA